MVEKIVNLNYVKLLTDYKSFLKDFTKSSLSDK